MYGGHCAPRVGILPAAEDDLQALPCPTLRRGPSRRGWGWCLPLQIDFRFAGGPARR